MFNEVIVRFIAIKGAVWYDGENAIWERAVMLWALWMHISGWKSCAGIP